MRVTVFYLKSVTKRSSSSSSARGRERRRMIERGDKKGQSITKIFIILTKKNFFGMHPRHRETHEKYSKAMYSHRNSKKGQIF